MAAVHVLKTGYVVPEGAGKERADCTITLIRSGASVGQELAPATVASDVNVLVDTGNPQDGEQLARLLAAEGLSPSDISVVVCTHGHSDHTGNNGLFPHALFVIGTEILKGDLFTSHEFGQAPYVISDEIEVIATPGHSSPDVSVLAKTPEGLVAVAGDLFESEEDLRDQSRWIERSEDPETQRTSRESVLMTADYIVPGHGGMFRVPWVVG